MDDKERCQSCGMPLSAEFGNYGTAADGKPVTDYCVFCYADGGFRNPDQTLEEMIRSSIDNMTNDLGIPLERATELANTVIPALRRWKN